MKRTNFWFSAVLSLGMTIMMFPAASSRVSAASATQYYQNNDPPSRVARLNYFDGTVSFEPASLDQWGPAEINYPITTGDELWSDYDSRAEIHIGSTAIRLGSQTDFSFLNLDDETAQMKLSQGSLSVRIRHLYSDQVYEVDTPNVAVSLVEEGEYRVDVSPDGNNTTVTVDNGEADVAAGGDSFSVYSDQTATINGVEELSYDIQEAYPTDDFDQWDMGRDYREDQLASVQYSQRYVSPEVVGYEDLNQYGNWQTSSSYGAYWVPQSVPQDWAPYRYGHWAWVSPWGWTWVDNSPWGFAPFHYGRWAYVDNRWGWVPGQVVERPVYAPALVAFVNPTPGISISLGFGNSSAMAWFPLGPGEAYVPAYRTSPRYIQNLNTPAVRNYNTTNITNINRTNVNVTNYNITNVTYVNRSVPNAVTAVPSQAFVSARPVQSVAVTVPVRVAASATIAASMTAPVAPQRQSLIPKPATASAGPVRQPPAAAQNRQAVARVQPPPPPVPFAAREKALAAKNGKPLDRATIASLAATSPPAKRVPVKMAVAVAGKSAAPSALKPARADIAPTKPATTAKPVPTAPNNTATRRTARPAGTPGANNRVAPAAASSPQPVRPRTATGATVSSPAPARSTSERSTRVTPAATPQPSPAPRRPAAKPATNAQPAAEKTAPATPVRERTEPQPARRPAPTPTPTPEKREPQAQSQTRPRVTPKPPAQEPPNQSSAKREPAAQSEKRAQPKPTPERTTQSKNSESDKAKAEEERNNKSQPR